MESKNQYIEIDSSYRDRNLYPNPFDFTVIVSNKGNSSNSNEALNPISNSYPIYNFQGPHPELLGIDKDFSGNDTRLKFGSNPVSRFGGTGEINSFTKFHDINNFIVPILSSTYDLSTLDKVNNLVNFDSNNNPIITYLDSRTGNKWAVRTLKNTQYGNGATIKFSPSLNSYGCYYNNQTKVNNVFQIGLTNNWGYTPGTSDDTFVTQYAMTYSWKITNNKIQINESNPEYGNTATIDRGSSYDINSDDIYQILYNGTNIIYYRNGSAVRTVAARNNETVYGLSMIFTGYLDKLTTLTNFLSFDKYTTYSNQILDVNNPWNINTQIGNNNYGPGTKKIPNLDGVPVTLSYTGNSTYQTIKNTNKLYYSDNYNYSFESSNSYSKLPYASNVDNYYDGLTLCRYATSDPSGNNSLESNLIMDYKGFNTYHRKVEQNKDMFYDKGYKIISDDIDTSTIIYKKGYNSCNLDNSFLDTWDATNYWSINETSLLSVSNPQEIVIHGGSDVDDYYTGYYLEDCTLPLGTLKNDSNTLHLSDFNNRFKKILSYDGRSKIATLTNGIDKEGFPISNYVTTGYTKLITDNNYNKININPDRANPYTINTGESHMSYILQDKLSYFNNDIYSWSGADASGSKGWIPQDRYRIRKELPLVMGWGFNEDRDGAHARIGGLTDNNEEKYQNNLFSGTGPRNGYNGAVISFEILNGGAKFGKKVGNLYTIDNNIVYSNGTALNNNSIENIYLRIMELNNKTGEMLSAEIQWPGGNFQNEQEVTIYNDGVNDATIKIISVGQSIDISNAYKTPNNTTTGVLSTIKDDYNGELLYIPSKGPEKKSSQYATKYNLTGYLKSNEPYSCGKDPPYINQFPNKIENDSYTNDDSGVVPISKFITSNATKLHVNRTASTNLIDSNYSSIWKGSPGWHLYNSYDSSNNTTQKKVWTFPTINTWNGLKTTANDGNNFIAVEDDYNQTHNDNWAPGIVTEQYLVSGSYNIIIDAYRSMTGDFSTENIKTMDISGNGIIMIQNPDDTYVSGLPNPYNGDTTMSVLSDISTNSLHTIPVTISSPGIYKVYLRFAGSTVSSTTTTLLNSTNTGGGIINVIKNASPSFYTQDNLIHLFVGRYETKNSGIDHYKNTGTSTVRYLTNSGYAPNNRYDLENSWGYGSSNTTFKNASITIENLYKYNIVDNSGTNIAFIGYGDDSFTNESGYNINGNIFGYFYNSNNFLTEGADPNSWEIGYTSSNLIKADVSGVLQYIDVGNNASPAFLKTDNTISISNVNVPKVDLYVGNKDGYIRYYEFGVNTNLSASDRNYKNDWTDRGHVQNNASNYLKVLSNSSPSFVDINGNGIKHLFVGDGSGNLHFSRNTGTNLVPVWQPFVNVKDTNGDNITVPSNSKPAFSNIRGLDPAIYDLFIGDGSGNIHYYKNNGTGGPWDGSTTTWPFVKNTYQNGLLSNHAEPTNQTITEPTVTLTDATDFSGNSTSADTSTGKGSVVLWSSGEPNTELFYIKKNGNILTLDGNSIPSNINFPINTKITTKNFPGTAKYSYQNNTWVTSRSHLSPWSRGWIVCNGIKIQNTTLLENNRVIMNFGQSTIDSYGQQWQDWKLSSNYNTITKTVLAGNEIRLTVDGSNNLTSNGMMSFYLGSLRGSYKLSVYANSSRNNCCGIELNSIISNDDYDHNEYNFHNYDVKFEQQGSKQYGILNRGINYNGRVIGYKNSEIYSKPFTTDKQCYQYAFNGDGRCIELKVGFNSEIGSFSVNDTCTVYHVILTKEDIESDWILANGYRDMSGIQPTENFFIDTSGGQTTANTDGKVAVIVTSNGFNKPVTGNIANGMNSNTGVKTLYNFDVSGNCIKNQGNEINIGTNSTPFFYNSPGGTNELDLYCGQENGNIISYLNDGTTTLNDFRYNNVFPYGDAYYGQQQNWGNNLNNAVFKNSSIILDNMYYSNGYDTSGVTNIALIGWGEGSTTPNVSNISGMISSYIYNSFSSDIVNTQPNNWQVDYDQFLKHGNFDSEDNQSYIDVGDNASPALLPTGVNVNVNISNDIISTPKIDLYVGNKDGNIKYYEFGQITLSNRKLDFTNNWTSRGNIVDSASNVIDVGSNSKPIFANVNGDGIYHLFIGCGDGRIKFYRNTGTNASPVWASPGLYVQDTNGDDIDVGQNARPIFANIRGVNNDLFIGNNNGNIIHYRNNGNAGPWDGSTTTWPYVKTVYKNGILTDNKQSTTTLTGASLIPVNGFNRVNMRNSYNWEILPCDSDGVNNLNYLGESKNYDYYIRLKNITLPNSILTSSKYNRLSLGSYIYVQFNNSDTPLNNIIFSNNTNSSTALFKVSIKNIHNIKDSVYCKLNGDDMVHKINLNLKNNYVFKVFYEDGSVVNLSENDTIPPSYPNRNLQVSATFEITRV